MVFVTMPLSSNTVPVKRMSLAASSINMDFPDLVTTPSMPSPFSTMMLEMSAGPM